jgi:HAMP domain-containing protein
VAIAVTIILCAAGIVSAVRGIGGVIAEGAAVKAEAAALFTGDYMPLEKKKRIIRIKTRGLGLRFKLSAFTIVLVLLVVTMVSMPLYFVMTRTQRETLLQSLWDRSGVLLESLASNTRVYLPMANPELELINLPAQMSAIPEAQYVTITGYGSGNTIHNDHVWASNDPDILSKIDTAELRPGVSRLSDGLDARLEDIGNELNERARAEIGDFSHSITELTEEAISLAARTDAESRRRTEDIQLTIHSLQARISRTLTVMARQIGSEPGFPTSRISGRLYVLFRPVMFRHGGDDNYFRGLIRMEISVDSVEDQISYDQVQLLRIILIFAAFAVAIGIIGALVLSSLIIRPIRKLAGHVERIRDTEDKSKLAGVDIHIGSRDEIALLGNTVNDMTHGLVKAAGAASDLSIGKEIQKKFIPLETDRDGNKLTSGYKETKYAHFFGYYEGAKGVSGDYFDYQDLDGRYYAIIKCDAAGK